MRTNEWILELIKIFDKETDVITKEFESNDFSGRFSKNTDFVMAQITYFAKGLSRGYLTIEEVKKIGIKYL